MDIPSQRPPGWQQQRRSHRWRRLGANLVESVDVPAAPPMAHPAAARDRGPDDTQPPASPRSALSPEPTNDSSQRPSFVAPLTPDNTAARLYPDIRSCCLPMPSSRGYCRVSTGPQPVDVHRVGAGRGRELRDVGHLVGRRVEGHGGGESTGCQPVQRRSDVGDQAQWMLDDRESDRRASVRSRRGRPGPDEDRRRAGVPGPANRRTRRLSPGCRLAAPGW